MSLRPSLRPRLLGLVLASSAAACAVGPDYETPELVIPTEFANVTPSGVSSGVSSIVESPTHVTWWKLFGDPVLEDLVTRAAASNLDLEVASARLREARALRRSATLDLGPVANANAGYTRTVLPQTTFQGASYDVRDREIYDAGFDASWELDVFGRLRRALEANDAEVGAALAARRDVLVSVLAEVARNYFDLRGAQAQLEVNRRNLDNQRRTADLTISRLEGGRGTDLDVARAQAQLHATRATLPVLEALVARSAHRIGVLLGDPPTFHVARLDRPATLPDLPDLLTIGKPAQLLERRPDIRIAERQLHSATARIGVARADYFPRLTLHGSIELNVSRLSSIGHGGAEAFSFGPRLSWAAFDLGHVMAAETAAEERANAAFARYHRAVLLALEETENTLVGFTAERARRDALRDATRETVRAAQLARERFNDGVTDFLTVLDAERRLLEAQDALAASEARTLSNLVLVYKALGGGWETFEEVEE